MSQKELIGTYKNNRNVYINLQLNRRVTKISRTRKKMNTINILTNHCPIAQYLIEFVVHSASPKYVKALLI